MKICSTSDIRSCTFHIKVVFLYKKTFTLSSEAVLYFYGISMFLNPPSVKLWYAILCTINMYLFQSVMYLRTVSDLKVADQRICITLLTGSIPICSDNVIIFFDERFTSLTCSEGSQGLWSSGCAQAGLSLFNLAT